MRKQSMILLLIVTLAVVGLFMDESVAQPTPGGFPYAIPNVGPSSPSGYQVPNPSGSQSGLVPYNPFGYEGPVPPENQLSPIPGEESNSEHPTEGPQAAIPSHAPSANTGNVLENLEGGQTLDTQSIIANFGSEPESSSEGVSGVATSAPTPKLFAAPPAPSGIQIWAFYNGQWTQGPSSVSLYQQENIAVLNDQTQNLWGYDSNGFPMWSNWGFRWPGFTFSSFYGDQRGWHLVAMWGSRSGWSNVLPIYVW